METAAGCVMVKSGASRTWTGTVAWWVRLPDVTVTVTEYVPGAVPVAGVMLIDGVDARFGERLNVAGLTVHVPNWWDGTAHDAVRLPENVRLAATLTVPEAVCAGIAFTGVVPAVTVKSGATNTLNVTCCCCVCVCGSPPTAVIVTGNDPTVVPEIAIENEVEPAGTVCCEGVHVREGFRFVQLIWMGNEYIPNAPRTVNANWGTFIGGFTPQ